LAIILLLYCCFKKRSGWNVERHMLANRFGVSSIAEKELFPSISPLWRVGNFLRLFSRHWKNRAATAAEAGPPHFIPAGIRLRVCPSPHHSNTPFLCSSSPQPDDLLVVHLLTGEDERDRKPLGGGNEVLVVCAVVRGRFFRTRFSQTYEDQRRAAR